MNRSINPWGFRWSMAPAAAVFATAVFAAEGAAPRPVADFRVILTDDGVLSFTDLEPQRSEAALRAMIRSLQTSPVKTLVYEVAAGSQVMFYLTKVGSVWGWRKAGAEAEAAWVKRIPINRAAAASGLDAVRTAGSEAKAMGMYFMPGYRINDAHFAHEPMRNVLTGEFWLKHHERLALGTSPIPGDNRYQHLFDFSHPEVREHSLAVIYEIIDRYADIMDGLQLDFMRHPVFFSAGTAPARSSLMTDLVFAVRQRLDVSGRRAGRFLALSVRVPPTLATCRGAGLEVEQWIARQLVDVVIPAPSITLSHDLPVDEFAALATPRGVKIYPALFPRTQFHWPIVRSPAAKNYAGTTGRDVSEAHVRGAVRNYLSMGAAGFELYNFNLPPEAVASAAFNALASPHHGDRVYAITPAYYAEREGTFEYRKQIPAALSPETPADLTIVIGEDLTKADLRRANSATLRLGLHGLGKAKGRFLIEMNAHRVYEGDGGAVMTPVSGRESRPSRMHPPATQVYLQVRLTDGGIFHPGRNRLVVRLQSPNAAANLQIVEAQIAVLDNAP
ncbi:MAG: hypothetical protein EXS37_02515 [Opitutus sp.]|nr:hypothetical protein [Opitutus sp.]